MTACDIYAPAERGAGRGSLVKLTYLQRVTPLGYAISIALSTDLISPTIDQSVDLYRMEYESIDPHGAVVTLSALVGLPERRDSVRALVGYFHGTVFSAVDAPSRSALEGPMTVATYAGKGLAVLAPDNLGLGTSVSVPDYLMGKTTAVNMVDAFLALRSALALVEIGVQFPNKLYLTGASQGGQVAMATMAALEATGDPQLMPDAVAAVAGVYFMVNPGWQNPSADSRVFGFENCFTGDEGLYSIYLSQAVHSYTYWLGGDPSAVLKSEWAETARKWLDGQHTKFEVYSAWNWEEADPADDILPPAILSSAFLAEYRAYRRGEGPAPWIVEQLARQVTVTKASSIPVRLYYGEKDDVAVPAETMAAAAVLGLKCQTISLGQYGHGSTILKSVPEVQTWFAELAGAD